MQALGVLVLGAQAGTTGSRVSAERRQACVGARAGARAAGTSVRWERHDTDARGRAAGAGRRTAAGWGMRGAQAAAARGRGAQRACGRSAAGAAGA